MNFHIEGRRWCDSFGNTYHSVRIFQDGEQIAYIPFEYGYSDHYIQTALKYLEDNNLILHNNSLPAKDHQLGYGTRRLREGLKSSYSVIDVQRKKDL